MRILAIVAFTIAIFLAALTLPSAPDATASLPAPNGATVDPHALQTKVDMKSLPEQHTGDLF